MAKPQAHTLFSSCLLFLAAGTVPALADVPHLSEITPQPAISEPLPWWRAVIESPLDLLWFALGGQRDLPPPPMPDLRPTSFCPVQPLSAVEDRDALAFENGETLDTGSLTAATNRALTRLETIVTKVGGTFELQSAYRPPAYQQHLIQVWDKWMVELRDNPDPSCQPLRSDVWSEFQRHALLESQRPAEFSDHLRGLAFDAAVILPRRARWGRRRATLDLLARVVGLHRPIPRQDWVHYKLIR